MERTFLVYAADLCVGRLMFGKNFSGVCGRFVCRETDIGEEFSHVCRRVVSKETDTLRKSFYGGCLFVYRDTDNN